MLTPEVLLLELQVLTHSPTSTVSVPPVRSVCVCRCVCVCVGGVRVCMCVCVHACMCDVCV